MPVKQYGDLLVTYLRSQGSRVLLLTGLLFGGIGLQLINPQVIRYFIDTAQARGSQSALAGAALLFLIIALVGRAITLATDYVAENIGWTATNALRADLTLHCLRLDMSFHKKRTPGELIERIDGDVTALANFFSRFVVNVLGNAVLVIGILVLLFREDARVGAGLAIYTMVTLLALRAIQNVAVARWAAERQADAELFGFVEERISGTEDIRASGAEPYVMNRLYHLMRGTLVKNRAARMMSNVTHVITNFLFVIGYAVGLALGAYLYTQGQVTIGAAFLIVYYIGMLSGPLENIRTQAQDLQQATASINRVGELFRTQSRIPATTPRRTEAKPVPALPSGPLAVTFQDVCFAYDEAETINNDSTTGDGPSLPVVLHDVSFHLSPGKVLGLLGRTGSGKTTLSRLLFRLYGPTSGAIRFGDVDIRDMTLSDLREHIGMVTQDVQLFQATVRNNLTFFNRRIGDDQIERVLKELRLWDWVQSLPDGLNTPLASGGQGLSAGEAQLLAFTRVFLKNPGLVILDEASSRMDPVTLNLLDQAVDRLFHAPPRTGIIIAHRLQTVQRADDILILEHGRVVEYGARERLAADPGSRFYSLLSAGAGLEEALA
jgi:ATP-binding cassette subfamily B protein